MLKAGSLLGLKPLKFIAFAVIALLVFQQVVVSSSSYFLVEFLESLQASKPWKLALGLYLASVVIPYIPGFAAIYVSQLWINSNLSQLWHEAVERMSGNSGAVFSHELKADYAGQVKELGNLVEDSCRFILGYMPAVLNFIFNGLVVAQLLGGDFMLAFVIGMAISSVQVLLSSKYGSRLANAKQDALGDVDVHFAKGWQTLLIGNTPHVELFNQSLGGAKSEFFRQGSRLALFENGTSLVFFFLGFAPTLFVILRLALDPSTTNAKLIALGALLPRIFQIFTVSSNVLIGAQQIFSLSGRWQSALSRLNSTMSKRDLASRINYSRLILESGEETVTLKAGFDISTLAKGRWRLKGENGAGKSSWMLKAKCDLGTSGYYLPAKSDEFDSTAKGSTGQKKLAELQALLMNAGAYGVIFLDEWDANLDAGASAKASVLIDEMSKVAIIVECGH